MKKINVTRSSLPPLEEYMNEISDIWESRWLTNNGPKHQQLEQKLCELLQVKGVALFSNGHQALEAVFSRFQPGSEIITTPFTFASTTMAIARCGLIPVFCDIETDFYTMDPNKIEALITDKTVAIAPVHVYGNLCDWKHIESIAKKHNLKVIYDAAHAFGVFDGEKSVGSLGDLSMFSFHATKVFNTIEGGCLTYNSDEAVLPKDLAAWRQFGMYDGVESEILGTNAKMTEFQAAMGLCNLRHLDRHIASRQAVFLRYEERLWGKRGFVLCQQQKGISRNYAYLPLRIIADEAGFNRDQLADKLLEHNIAARKYFHPLTSEFRAFQRLFHIQETPLAHEVSTQVICLPLYEELTLEDVDAICDIILS